jgi:membrane-associated phospholipid phosphatase
VLVMTITTIVNAGIKELYDRPRPPQGLEEHFTASFTSGHALTAAVVVLLVVLVWVPAGPRRRSLFLIGAVYALIVAASRVYLRVHWFSDVVAGLAVGVVTGLALLFVLRWWLTREAKPPIASSGQGDASSGPTA